MANENKTAVIAAIWENPGKAFGCDFKQSGRYWVNLKNDEYDEVGKIRLTQTSDGGNIMVFYNGASRTESSDVFTYLDDYVLHAGGFRETLRQLAELYGVELRFTPEERQALTRASLAKDVAATLVEHLRTHNDGATARYLRDVRGVENDGTHFGELTRESIAAVRENLKARGKTFKDEDLEALHVTEANADMGFNCVIPYRVNGYVRGFVFRNVKPDAARRYDYSVGLGRKGYCDALTHGEPAVIVEGQFDAVRLIQAGVKNVIGVGGAKIGEDIARLLYAHGIRQVTYVPDLEHDAQGNKKTDIIEEEIKAFISAQVDGEPVFDGVFVAELPTPADFHTNAKYKVFKDGKLDKYKYDADSYGKDNGGAALAAVVADSVAAWAWRLDGLIEWAKAQETVNIPEFRRKFGEIYKDCNPYERQVLRDVVEDKADIYRAFGITSQALNDVDEWKRNNEYNNRIKDGAEELNKAVQEGASPERVAAIIRKLSDAQATNTRDEWNEQLGQTFADGLNAIKEQPETLKTKWEVGAVDKNGTYYKHDNIEFYPADIEVFCAPTSHGKTMILFQSVLDLINTTDKTFLYVSCEENKRQLLERALNVFIDIPTTPDGLTSDDKGKQVYCFKPQTRKKTIKSVIRKDVAPFEYRENIAETKSEHYDALSKQIDEEIKRYERQVFPRLKLLHTEASVESICTNVLNTVEEYRRQGVDVGGVFVDYMQLLTTENSNYSRHDELKDICKALKDCAARTELPIVIAAQLNRETLKGGIDTITVANIGEGADIERIAHDIYLVWQIDKTQESLYKKPKQLPNGDIVMETDTAKFNIRSNRIFLKNGLGRKERELKAGYIYVERMKARDGKTEGWALLPFDGERGYIGNNDKEKMTE